MNITDLGTAKLSYQDNEIELPLLEGTIREKALDISKLRGATGLVTLDSGYGNTGSCGEYFEINFRSSYAYR